MRTITHHKNIIIQELDMIWLSRDMPEHGLKQGDVGTVVHCDKNNKAFEFEFVTGEGDTIAVLTLTQADIRPVRHREILHARELMTA